jgi:DNA-binding transcriptional LysR family regulator
MREKHPAAAKKWTIADYAKWESVVVSILGDGQSDVDARLAKAGVVRRIGMSTPHFMAALTAVSANDMIANTSHVFALRYARVHPRPCGTDYYHKRMRCSGAR